MFENLTDRLSETLRHITGKARLTEENIAGTLREVRVALLEADVALGVVKTFIDQVRARAVGVEVGESLSPGQQFVQIVNEELVNVLGRESVGLDLRAQPPAVILLAGLQGAGKTTAAAKLAKFLRERMKKSVMLVSADVYRPAAITQLETLAGQVQAKFCPSSADETPDAIVTRALDEARKAVSDVLIVDTAGRLAIDTAMMAEVARLHEIASPVETLFVVDAMTGQDAANTAAAFGAALPLTGVVLTKVDGDARGGAALSVRQITGKPIKFLGLGEKVDALEPFHPDRIASRILGMGDILSLIEEAQRKVDRKKADKLARKLQKGRKFDLADFRDQLQQMKNLGGVAGMLDKLPGMGGLGAAAKQIDDRQFVHFEALINSMTPAERVNPDVLNGSRKQRICRGSGLTVQDLNRLLKQHKQMQKMMKKLGGKGGQQKMMNALGALGGGGAGGPGSGGLGGLGGPGGGLPGLGGSPFKR